MPPESRVFPQTPIYLVTLFLLWLAAYGSALFRPALLDDADSVHAEAAREMVLGNDWVTLHANGIRYLEKAPLLYWAMAASFKIFGIHDWSARLPLALSVLALLFSVYFLGRPAFGEAAGFYAALVSGIALGPYLFTRFLIPDVLVGLWLILSLGFFLRTFDGAQPSHFACWGLAASCALNVLTKGLIGLVFPLAAIGLYLLLTGQLRHFLKLRLVSSSLLFLAIAAPWHILAGLRNPDQGNVRGFFWFYFVNEHFLRYLDKRVPRDYGTVPLLLFWGLLLVWLFPWSSFLPQALASVKFSRIRETVDSPVARAKLVFLLGAFFVVLFFSFSTRQEYYVLPALPALALLVGSWLAEEEASPAGSRLRRWGKISSSVLAVLGLLAGILTIALAISAPPVSPGADIAGLLNSGRPESQQYALSLGHFLDLNLRAMAMLRVPLLLFGLSFFLGSALNWHFRQRERPDLGNWSLAAMSVCLLIAIHIALVTFSPLLTSKPLADAIARVYQPGDIIEINGEYEGGSTLNYYTGQQVRLLNGRSANLWYGSYFPDAPQIFDDSESFQRLWAGPQRAFLWTELESRDRALAGIDGRTVFTLARSGGKLVLTNRPVP
ncbi:MAG TPA: glycosyltransferase family 39 protein [Candidatus Acidoferrum sp.]|nr:glycosyltransferase family 39 protein [Candidatus Acidoferrum sp.]